MDVMKSFSLEGKVALVTGAAYGIGFAMAEAYSAESAWCPCFHTTFLLFPQVLRMPLP